MNSISRHFCYLMKPNTVNRFVAYKSAVSLNSLYPQSSLKITTPSKPPSTDDQFSGFIPVNELNITYSRSTGPGGQNVNTLNSKVDLRFNVQNATWINEEIKSKLIEKYKTKITKDGFLVFRSDLTRSQQLNLADCLEKVRTAIRTACLINPEMTEETKEKIRRRQERAARERLNMKRQKSQIKAERKSPSL